MMAGGDPSDGTLVEFRRVIVEIKGRRIVGPVDLSVTAGETVVLLGRSGAGKTTLLKLVNDLRQPTRGAVRVNGRSTKDWNVVALRRRIGYVIQEVGLFPHWTVERNVGVVPRLEGWPAGRTQGRVAELLALVGLDPETFMARYPHQLSGGQRQRVGVARALAADPPLLLCDEPFGAVDPVTRRELQDEFRALAARLHKTVLFVTHDVREAVRLADRIAVLHEGSLTFVGSPDEFAASRDCHVEAFRQSA
jgi:osmoprotectant transport system ATP-binding protein